MRTTFLAIAFLIVVIIAGIIYLHLKNTTNSHIAASSPGPLPIEQVVMVTKSGFSPPKIVVKTGTAVRWVNKLGNKASVNSDNYPTNQLHKELNLGAFTNGTTLMHIFTQPGSYGYHDQFRPSFIGTIIVEK